MFLTPGSGACRFRREAARSALAWYADRPSHGHLFPFAALVVSAAGCRATAYALPHLGLVARSVGRAVGRYFPRSLGCRQGSGFRVQVWRHLLAGSLIS